MSPISLSHHPPYQGARFGMNCQSIPMLAKASLTDVDSKIVFRYVDAEQNVNALSNMISFGKDFRLANLRKACRKDSSDILVTTSKCTALVVAQVNRQMYALPSFPLDCRINKAAVKKVQVGKDQEKAQSEKDSHSKNRGGKKTN